jgi:hypothetical protein
MDAVCTDPAPWTAFYRRWRYLEPPLRPNAEVCAVVRDQLTGHTARVLLLGATPELADFGAQTFAVDRSESALGCIWPGSTAARHAVRGHWQHLPCVDGSISAAIGDGSLNCVDCPSGYERIYAELARVVGPGGRIVIRVYVTPRRCESMSDVRDAVLTGRVGTIHSLKWRLAMAICTERATPIVAVQEILCAFNRQFPDRSALRQATGWTDDHIAQMDAYADLPEVFSFPTSEQLLASVPREFVGPRLVGAGTYELADRCPLLVMDVRS